MSISIDRELAIELIQSKLEILDSYIEQILDKWGYTNIDDFLNDARSGRLEEESIDDGLDLTNLVDKRNEVANLLKN